MRSTLKNQEYYTSYQSEKKFIIDRSKNWLAEGKVPQERIPIAIDGIRSAYLKLCISGYSAGNPINEMTSHLLNAISYVKEGWPGSWKFVGQEGKVYDQYILSAYDEMLWMLSLGYLLDIPDEEFRKLVHVIDQDQVKDRLFEFIIRAKIKDRPVLAEESYIEHFNVPQIFEKLRTAIDKPKAEAEKLVKEFIEKDWYKNHKGAGWYDSHKGKYNTYFGYWSFETAAVVKIMGLDDRTFRDCSYYPKDLL
jgi:hypothetical protein